MNHLHTLTFKWLARYRRLLVMPLLAACGGMSYQPAFLPPQTVTFADTFRTKAVAPGVTHYYMHVPIGPWAISVLDVDMRLNNGRCYSALAAKDGEHAAGRATPTQMLKQIAKTHNVVGGINGDFYTAHGVPRGALIKRGRVIVGPSKSATLAFDSSGAGHVLDLDARGTAVIKGKSYNIISWNHRASDGLALYDRNWGEVVDKDSLGIEVALSGRNPSIVVSLDSTNYGSVIPENGIVLAAGINTPKETRDALLALRPGDTVYADVSLTPFHPLEAIGGHPMLVRDSAVVDFTELLKPNDTSFVKSPNMRSSVGVSSDGKRLILAVVDWQGRSNELYSRGMSLPELANLLISLGAYEAINLDGSGSATLVYTDTDSARTMKIANRLPADDAITVLEDPPDSTIGVRMPEISFRESVFRKIPNKLSVNTSKLRPVIYSQISLYAPISAIDASYLNGRITQLRRGRTHITHRYGSIKIISSTSIASGSSYMGYRMGKILDNVGRVSDLRYPPLSLSSYRGLENWKKGLPSFDTKAPKYAYTPDAVLPVERTIGDALAIVSGCSDAGKGMKGLR